jgi:hypothetical protein
MVSNSVTGLVMVLCMAIILVAKLETDMLPEAIKGIVPAIVISIANNLIGFTIQRMSSYSKPYSFSDLYAKQIF